MTDRSPKRNEPSTAAAPGMGENPSRAPAAGVDPQARRRIGRDLRLLYARVLDLPLSERLAQLVDELRAHDRKEGRDD